MILTNRASNAVEALADLRARWAALREDRNYLRSLAKDDATFSALRGVAKGWMTETDRRACASLQAAEAFWWDRSILDVLEASAPSLPTWTLRPELFLVPDAFHLFAKPLTVRSDRESLGESSYELAGFMWSSTPSDALLMGFSRTGRFGYYWDGPLRPHASTWWEMGDDVVDAITHESGSEAPALMAKFALFVGAALLFLEQRIAVASRESIDRPARRRLEKADIKYPALRVIRLRTSEHRAMGESLPVDWQYRWIVRGHWRQQWYASDGSHRPIWILPHMKGPDDKPLKTPDASVFAVVR